MSLTEQTQQAATIDSLLRAVPREFHLDAQLLVGHVLGRSRAQVLARPETTLDTEDEQTLKALIARRVAAEPLAYLLGEREFFGLAFSVCPSVLIPRPETELLVEQCLAQHRPGRACSNWERVAVPSRLR